MGIEFSADNEIKELEQDVETSRVLDALERESKLKQGSQSLKASWLRQVLSDGHLSWES
jgi:ribosome assembly protein YihI (activator of Der GTPase)